MEQSNVAGSALAEFAAGESASDHVPLGSSLSPLEASWAWAMKRAWSHGVPASSPSLLTLPAGETKDDPQAFLPMGKVGLLVGPGAMGKTMALLQLAISVTTGRPWLGHYHVPEASRGPVVLALAEEDQEEASRRLWAMRKALELSEEEWRLVEERLVLLPLAGKSVALTSAKSYGNQRSDVFEDLERLLSTANQPWRLLMLDPLARWAGPDTEVDNDAATRFIASLEALTQVPGRPTVLVAHHTTKEARWRGARQGASAARGSGALTDGARWVATLSSHETRGKKLEGDSPQELLQLTVVKSNYTAQPTHLVLRREDGGVLVANSSKGPAATKGDTPKPTSADRPKKGTSKSTKFSLERAP